MANVKIVARGGVDDVRSDFSPKKVLIIEDNENFLEMVGGDFEAKGFQTIKAKSGKVGFDFAKKEKPDVIILDILLEDIDGFEVLKLLKEDLDTHLILVVIYTNLGSDNDRMMGLRLGADAYYQKTELSPLKLVDEVKELINKNI